MVDFWSNPDAKPYVNVFQEKVQIVKGAKDSASSFGGENLGRKWRPECRREQTSGTGPAKYCRQGRR